MLSFVISGRRETANPESRPRFSFATGFRARAYGAPRNDRGTSLDSFDRERNPLPHADAHAGERALAALLDHLMRRRDDKPRAGHAERMTERDGAAVRIDVLGVVRKPELAEARQRLRGERLVQFDHVEVA